MGDQHYHNWISTGKCDASQSLQFRCHPDCVIALRPPSETKFMALVPLKQCPRCCRQFTISRIVHSCTHNSRNTCDAGKSMALFSRIKRTQAIAPVDRMAVPNWKSSCKKHRFIVAAQKYLRRVCKNRVCMKASQGLGYLYSQPKPCHAR